MLLSSFRVLGMLLMMFSTTLLPPIFVSWYFKDGVIHTFYSALLLTFFVGFFSWLATRKTKRELRTRDGFLVVVLLWAALCLFGALPFMLLHLDTYSIADAVFESVSGLTTTGSTVMEHIDVLPKSIIYYRQQLQLLGGMGIIVLAVAVLPMLGVGGMQMFRAETSGPVKDNKLTPRIAETAKTLWLIYIGLTILCMFCFWASGMTLFDAINYSFATVSTGGYAPHNASLRYYNYPSIKIVAIVFMILGSMNFSLHFITLQRKNLLHYFKDTEFRTFLYLLLFFSIITYSILISYDVYTDSKVSFFETIFTITSLLTTTGFTSANFSAWPNIAPYLILTAGLIGGCAGSTSGGIKIVRLLILWKQGIREMKRLVHPAGKFILKLDHKAVPDRVIDAVWGFLGIYIVIFTLLTLSLVACGLDFNTAFSSAIAGLANVGPALGDTAANFHGISESAKWILSLSMLIGRLEIFTFFVLLTPTFWRS